MASMILIALTSTWCRRRRRRLHIVGVVIVDVVSGASTLSALTHRSQH
jgi:hypothetical protein